ncbi:exodeoxyribonuclease VII large subunit [Trichococcus ilyis]|uniref:Exodeoxyribonuclease 7 large subunit n=1 Tax=Trichococcus ilyis TaxID=640938 RepID=A0A143YSM9_9LACT|nr:exodeoxyribonuclease VII large subunit [Trichococcus ilyis]CZQ97706.1 exonuclease vii large subunit [Trichococcus ilyis]SEJ20472.1 Exodeoxyribonuclease VII large subunit [Trichococcus ilyis]
MEPLYLSVTALTKYIKRKFDADPYLERVYLTGEISNYRPRPGHQYFSLKDDHAVISAVMYKGRFDKLTFTPKEGMKVMLIGRVNVYEAGGTYNIMVEHMEPDGIGALYQAFSELKEKLAREGLFSLPKKKIPVFPKRIAIVTSPSGAVIRDIMTTVKRRYPIVQLVLYPTVVQGKDSAGSIIRNLQTIEQKGDYDLVIVARGGGSIEDLWSFNEETVVRQIAAMTIPVISSVGHETDTTLSDFVADVRAATPTAAAELSVPVLNDVNRYIHQLENRLYQKLRHLHTLQQQRLNRAMQSYIFRQPERMYEGYAIKADQVQLRLISQMQQQIQLRSTDLERLQLRLENRNPEREVALAEKRRQQLSEQLKRAMERYAKQQEQRLNTAMQSLDLLSPLKIMSRGYTYTTRDGEIVSSVKELQSGDKLKVNFSDGYAEAEVKYVVEEK